MYKIQGKANQSVWDSEKGEILCRFKDGFLETEDKKLASKLQKMGFKLVGEVEPEEAEVEPEEAEVEPEEAEKEAEEEAEPKKNGRAK